MIVSVAVKLGRCRSGGIVEFQRIFLPRSLRVSRCFLYDLGGILFVFIPDEFLRIVNEVDMILMF